MVNIVVCIKRVVDVSQVKVDQKNLTLTINGIPEKTSDFDKNAIETAVGLKEKHGGTITVVTVGSEKAQENLKEALAMGGDRGILATDQAYAGLDNRGVSKVLAKIIKDNGGADIVLLGEASIDMYSGQMVSRLAELLDYGQMSRVNKLELDGTKITASTDMGDRTARVEGSFPLVISVTKDINEPRFPNIMQIMQANKKPLDKLDAVAVGIDTSQLEIMAKRTGLRAISMDRKQVRFEGDESVSQLAEAINQVLGR